jgi:hypothetical protein
VPRRTELLADPVVQGDIDRRFRRAISGCDGVDCRQDFLQLIWVRETAQINPA